MTYQVTFTRDDQFWIATVRGIRGCHTQGRTIDAARRRIREALSLFVDDAKTATLKETIALPARVRKLLASYQASRKRAAQADQDVTRLSREVIQALGAKGLHLSTRDTATFLGLSHQRIHQLK